MFFQFSDSRYFIERNVETLEHFQKRCQFVRQRSLEVQTITSDGMIEAQFLGMEEESPERSDGLPYRNICHRFVPSRVVEFITYYRMVDVCEMNSYLMCSSRLYFDVKKGEFLKMFSDSPD